MATAPPVTIKRQIVTDKLELESRQKDEKVHQRLKWPPVTIKRQIVTDKLSLESHLHKTSIYPIINQ